MSRWESNQVPKLRTEEAGDTSAWPWAHQIWWWEIENSRKVTVLLKAISLVLWISYFPTKHILHDKNRTFSKRDFSAVGFLDLLKTLKTQRQKSLFLYVWFSLAKQCMVWFPNSWFYFISRKKCIIAMFISCFKKSEKNVYYVMFIY